MIGTLRKRGGEERKVNGGRRFCELKEEGREEERLEEGWRGVRRGERLTEGK